MAPQRPVGACLLSTARAVRDQLLRLAAYPRAARRATARVRPRGGAARARAAGGQLAKGPGDVAGGQAAEDDLAADLAEGGVAVLEAGGGVGAVQQLEAVGVGHGHTNGAKSGRLDNAGGCVSNSLPHSSHVSDLVSYQRM